MIRGETINTEVADQMQLPVLFLHLALDRLSKYSNSVHLENAYF